SFKELASNLRTQTGQRDNVIKGIMTADPYLPRMEAIFASFGLPSELTRITLAQSSFTHHAVSKAGAKGIWQFIESSGKAYMYLDEKGQIDERVSKIKSTVAAARLIKDHQPIFGTWPMTVTSYNYGVRVLRRIPAE